MNKKSPPLLLRPTVGGERPAIPAIAMYKQGLILFCYGLSTYLLLLGDLLTEISKLPSHNVKRTFCH